MTNPKTKKTIHALDAETILENTFFPLLQAEIGFAQKNITSAFRCFATN